MALPAGLTAQINVHVLTDTEIRKVMRDATAEADRILRGLEGVTGPGADLRRLQTEMAKMQVQAWGSVHQAVKVGVGDAFDASALLQSSFDEELFRGVGLSPRYWQMSMLEQSRSGIDQYLARKHFNYTLSDKVYRNTAISKGWVEREINNGLLLGKSAREIAASVKRFIDPSVPGGQSYAAMRLGRTELQNAFHTNSVQQAKNTPWVEEMKWNLSGSHPRPDLCNEYADNDGTGVWAVDDVPAKPHPNCLCFVTPITIPLDKFVSNFKDGQYDQWINNSMGCEVA